MNAPSSADAIETVVDRASDPDGPPRSERALVGCVLAGRYRVEAVLGKGGMGVVYEATHQALGRRVALKVLRTNLAADPRQLERFTQEARTASAIGSQHIVNVTDFGETETGSAFFVMEYLTGIPLSVRLKRQGALPALDAARILAEICDALDAAHACDVVHRDLKPANIFLVPKDGRDDFVKVLDFGIAKVLGATPSQKTEAGQLFGTPHYMAPEQINGSGIDHRADVYTAGLILFEMLTGRRPFDADSPLGVFSKQLYDPPPSLTEVLEPTAQTQALDVIVQRALAKRPEDRFQTMGELGAALCEAVPELAIERAGAPESIPLPRPSRPSQTARPPSPKTRWNVLVLGVLAVALLAGGLWTAANVGEQAPLRAQGRALPPLPPLPGEERSAPARETSQRVRIQTDPSGAEAFAEGAFIGRTPLTLERPEKGERVITLRTARHAPMELSLVPEGEGEVSLTFETTKRRPRSEDADHASEIRDPFAGN